MSNPPRLVLATRNQHKVAELRAILGAAGLDVELVGADAYPEIPDVAETGVTFAENALLKAHALARATGLPAVADDSGLCVDVLGGAPGIFSARWAGKHGDDRANLELLLAQLSDIAPPRGAHFACAAALALPDGTERVVEGRLLGTLRTTPSGDGGFGYDPILQPLGETRTCAELTPDEKNAISHRARHSADWCRRYGSWRGEDAPESGIPFQSSLRRLKGDSSCTPGGTRTHDPADLNRSPLASWGTGAYRLSLPPCEGSNGSNENSSRPQPPPVPAAVGRGDGVTVRAEQPEVLGPVVEPVAVQVIHLEGHRASAPHRRRAAVLAPVRAADEDEHHPEPVTGGAGAAGGSSTRSSCGLRRGSSRLPLLCSAPVKWLVSTA